MEEDIPVRYTFVMLLAIADSEGYAIGTDVALARRLNMPVEEFTRCVAVLSAPDSNSNSKEMEGRRLVASDSESGYLIVNYVKYRELTSEFQRKEYMRSYMREYRQKNAVKLTEFNSKTDFNRVKPPLSVSESASVSGLGSTEGKGYHQDARAALHILNESSGRHFRETDSNLSFISARLQEAGVDLPGVRQMIRRQCARWKGTSQEEFLRPETLFNKTKFDGYYAARDLPVILESLNAGPKPETLAEKKVRNL